MRCSYCGAPVEKGRVFCLNCGEEIQWVPEYHAIGSYRSNEQVSQQRASKEMTYPRMQPVQKEPEKKPEKRKKKKWPFVLVLFLAVIAAAVGILLYQEYTRQQQYQSFDYQYKMAEEMWRDQDYGEAMVYINRAVTLNTDRTDAKLLKARILYDSGQKEKCAEFLQAVIGENPDSEDAYSLLIQIYEEDGDTDSIRHLVDNISDAGIRDMFSEYLPVEVLFTPVAGDYEELLTVELYTEGTQKCIIYYTTDGTIPTEDSDPYKVGIPLTEGTTTIRAVAVNEQDIPGDIKSSTYEIAIPMPEVPVISPASGEYQSSAGLQIEIAVPDGCTAYYSFDEKPTTGSTKYTGPVAMPQGEYTFYAIIVNQNGKESYPGSATYVVK